MGRIAVCGLLRTRIVRDEHAPHQNVAYASRLIIMPVRALNVEESINICIIILNPFVVEMYTFFRGDTLVGWPHGWIGHMLVKYVNSNVKLFRVRLLVTSKRPTGGEARRFREIQQLQRLEPTPLHQ